MNLLREYIKELLTERVIELGDTSITLPRGIKGTQEIDLANPQTRRERRTAVVLSRFRDGIVTGHAAKFGTLGEDIAAAVLGGRQTNVYWDQSSLYSDVLVDRTYYSVKATNYPKDLTKQGISLGKIEKFVKHEPKSIAVIIMWVNGNNLEFKWTDPQLISFDDVRAIRQFKNTQCTDGSSDCPKWLYRGGMSLSSFRRLKSFASDTDAPVGVSTKTLLLPSADENISALERDYTIEPSHVRAKFRTAFSDFRVADLTEEQSSQVDSLLDKIKEIIGDQ